MPRSKRTSFGQGREFGHMVLTVKPRSNGSWWLACPTRESFAAAVKREAERMKQTQVSTGGERIVGTKGGKT